MSLFGDLNFYVYLCIIVLPAIALGLVGKSAKYYGLIATGLTPKPSPICSLFNSINSDVF